VLSDIGHLLSDVDYLLFDYVLYTSYIFPFSFPLFQVHAFLYSYSSFHFHLFSSLPQRFSHPLFPYLYYGIYSFIHALISSFLFLFSIYSPSSNLFTFSFSSFINLFVSSFAPVHCPCSMHTTYIDALQTAQLLCTYAHRVQPST